MSLARKLQASFLLIQRPVKARMMLLLGDDLDHCELDQPTGELNTKLFHLFNEEYFMKRHLSQNISFFI